MRQLQTPRNRLASSQIAASAKRAGAATTPLFSHAVQCPPGYSMAEHSPRCKPLCGYCTHHSPSLLHGLGLNAEQLAAYPRPGLQVSLGCVPACSLQRTVTSQSS